MKESARCNPRLGMRSRQSDSTVRGGLGINHKKDRAIVPGYQSHHQCKFTLGVAFAAVLGFYFGMQVNSRSSCVSSTDPDPHLSQYKITSSSSSSSAQDSPPSSLSQHVSPNDQLELWAAGAVDSAPMAWKSRCEETISDRIPTGKASVVKGFSQVKGDYLAFHTFFKNRTAPGIYLEIGAYHPIQLSNSAFFDICLGWHGICVEPDPSKLDVWNNARERSCTHFKKCLNYQDGNVCMGNLNDGTTSVTSQSSGNCKKGEAEVPCTTLEAMLESTLAASRLHQPISLSAGEKRTIDFVSLDVERSEMNVLRCFPFEKYDISMFLIETASDEKTYDWFMLNKGYLKWDNYRNGPYPTDTLYVKRSFLHQVYPNPLIDPGWREQPDRFNGREIPKLRCPDSKRS
mmetsp:Transcript_28708/g.69987  ORF Transcript_28708/g.69987 Transcript_28708/m.69987 type:complete len:402 (-) Transcript_28708:304-1509(-)|eukprot:CAMPEP_0114507324 /NCGR_PEP_ID=MMETSP0109-20121206/11946_1 /TAXON_ID=29199 /ORGANISM="Chlorarachnion reptans, Strain CCCM449" /LENGTH=401 /DNA_ID=CAMNT_0001686063 /DNA_START=351 /DNA_END=1556 /DNA_ORIENTATION=+